MTPVLLLLPASSAAPQEYAAAAEPDASGRPAGLRVFLDCAECALSEIRREIGYVDWVDDVAKADVHLRGKLRAAPTAELDYELTFVGLGRFAGRADTLRYRSSSAEPADERGAGLVQTIQLGLVRYAAETELAPHLRISFESVDGESMEAAGAMSPQRDEPTESAEPQPAAAEPKRWAAAIDLGFTGSSGNSDLMALTTGVRVRHLRTRVFRLDWSGSFRYGESGGEVAARHMQTKFDFDLGPEARTAPFISASGERDPFRRLDVRANVGTGMRHRVYQGDHGEASIRAAALYSHERFTTDAERDPRSDGIWSIKLTANQSLGENIQIESASTYDPVMGDFSDFNLDVTSKLSTRITRRLGLALTHVYTYDSTPVPDVRHADQRFQAGLTIEL